MSHLDPSEIASVSVVQLGHLDRDREWRVRLEEPSVWYNKWRRIANLVERKLCLFEFRKYEAHSFENIFR